MLVGGRAAHYARCLRAYEEEAELIAGEPVTTVPNANSLAQRMSMAGPQLVALA